MPPSFDVKKYIFGFRGVTGHDLWRPNLRPNGSTKQHIDVISNFRWPTEISDPSQGEAANHLNLLSFSAGSLENFIYH